MPATEVECHLFAWIGRTDLKAAAGDPDAGSGPIAQAVLAEPYKAIHLLSDFSALETQVYVNWLSDQTTAGVQSYPSKLSTPTNFGEIYEAVTAVLDRLQAIKKQLTFHLSPGTPAMAAVWILLAKTTWPARLIQSSSQAGVQVADVPFDIAAEFIPKLLQQVRRTTCFHGSGRT
jgi:hypothetical protein